MFPKYPESFTKAKLKRVKRILKSLKKKGADK
jgi:hypothetical protein